MSPQWEGYGFNSSGDSYFLSPDTSWRAVLERKMHVLFTLKLDIGSCNVLDHQLEAKDIQAMWPTSDHY